MTNPKKWQESLILEKDKTVEADQEYRTSDAENRTFFNTATLSNDYKLAQAYSSVRILEYRGEGSLAVENFDEYFAPRAEVLRRRFEAVEHTRPKFSPDEGYLNTRTKRHYRKGEVLVVVDKAIFSTVSKSINQYVLDIGKEGYWATIHTISGGGPTNIRGYIQQHPCVGVLLVGAIPAPWFELSNDFHGASTSFPCDLYYMDTNANWTDPDGNGKFNAVSGDVNPEIWVGRLWTPTANGNDSAMINDYFKRNHKFRLGQLGHARSALAYVDDDWTGFNDCGLDEQFPTSFITTYTNPDTTDADLYKAEVNSLRSWVQLCAHSSTQSHSLRVPSENKNEHIGSSYFRDTNPPNAHFYNLFCCGPGRYTSSDYLAGWYIFDKAGGGTNHGLTAVASAKSGSMLFFEDFYRELGRGSDIGTAYQRWWQARGPSHDLNERRWHYGLVLLGDPTLTWWKGNVPSLEQPDHEDVFDHYPRKMQFRWDPVNIPNVTYHVQVDYYTGNWAEETGRACYNYYNITEHTLDFNFVGKQRGRWRVRAKVDTTYCRWSPWSYFRFTV
ncbi:MAG: hypothetical protein KJ804_05235 [Proteobacteria bacterium]|nr:hypothetical protein [Pseudomonadota bacterium]MBU1057707.1 hypothetical protein [Pseudomonadota bacterium]